MIQVKITELIIIVGITEQHCHVTMYQFSDLAVLISVNISQHANANNQTIQVRQQLVIDLRN